MNSAYLRSEREARPRGEANGLVLHAVAIGTLRGTHAMAGTSFRCMPRDVERHARRSRFQRYPRATLATTASLVPTLRRELPDLDAAGSAF